METITKIKTGKIASKDLNAFLSQVNKIDPIQIRIDDGKVILFTENSRKDFKMMREQNLHHVLIKSDFSMEKEALQRFAKAYDTLNFELIENSELLPNGVMINGSHTIVDEPIDNNSASAAYRDLGNNGVKYELDVKLIEKILTHCSQEENRYVYNGICFQFSDNELLNIIATDGRRMAVYDYEGMAFNPEQYIIHYGALKSAIAIAKKKKIPTITWTFFGDVCPNTLQIDDIIIESEAVKGTFPDWKKVIPTTSNFKVFAEKDALLKVLKQCKETSEKPSYQVKIRVIDESTLKFTTEIPDLMMRDFELKVDHNLEPDFEIVLNSVFLLDAVKVLDDPIVRLGIVDSYKPLTISENSKTILVMPMKI